MDVSALLKQAWTAVQDADLPTDMHEVAFREAVRLMSPVPSLAAMPARSVPTGKVGASVIGIKNGDQDIDDALVAGVTESEIYDRVALATGVDRNRLEEIAHLDDGLLRVSLPGLKLGKNNAERARSVAQVLTIMRGFGLEEDGTLVDTIRGECARLKVYDQGNFAGHIGKITGFTITGAGRNRRMRPKAAGIEAFTTLVNDIVGER